MSELFGNSTKVDESVASLFKSSAGPVVKPKHVPEPKKEANINQSESSESSEEEPEVDDEEISEVSDVEFDDEEEDVDAILDKVGTKRKRKSETAIEDQYMEKIANEESKRAKKVKQQEVNKTEEDNDKEDSDDEESDNESDASDEEADESEDKSKLLNSSELEKAEATVFVGNVASSVITDKKQYKAFNNLFSEIGTIKSIRFRSIAFSEMLPRKAAYIKQKLHPKRDAVNAYVVFADKKHVAQALELNGTVFLDHHLRVDSVAHPAKQDNKRSVFVGNLDFETTEEQVWKHFNDCGEIEYVRLVRDSKTNVGKGFGYVQFKDSMCVPKALLMNEKVMEGAEGSKGRKLRISRCKNIKAPSSLGGNKGKAVGLTSAEKTKLGRAKRVLGKAGRAEVNKIVEGTRAKPGQMVPGLKLGGKGKRKGKPGRANK
uniref:Nucleolar protein 12 n=1 Tax=Blastobotrys adeninivorans TaxID=409370 RepID=A0A060TBA3_BLAAD